MTFPARLARRLISAEGSTIMPSVQLPIHSADQLHAKRVQVVASLL